VKVSNVTIHHQGKSDVALNLWSEPIHLKNITITGKPSLKSIQGGVKDGSIFDNLQIIGYHGADLPRGTYNQCKFDLAADSTSAPVVNDAGKYVFNECEFKGHLTGLMVVHPEAEVTVQNSTFEQIGDSSAISIQQTKQTVLKDNLIQGLQRTKAVPPLIKVSDYWDREKPHDIQSLMVKGNTLSSNLAGVIGISSIHAGVGAPPFTIENNKLVNTMLELKENDIVKE
jgi:hypothetical protein